MAFVFQWLAFLIAFVIALLRVVYNFITDNKEEAVLLFALLTIVVSLVLSLVIAFIGGLIFPDSATTFTLEILFNYMWSVIVGAIIPPIGEFLARLKLGD